MNKNRVWVVLFAVWGIGTILNVVVWFAQLHKVRTNLLEHEKTFNDRGVWMKMVDEKLDKLIHKE